MRLEEATRCEDGARAENTARVLLLEELCTRLAAKGTKARAPLGRQDIIIICIIMLDATNTNTRREEQLVLPESILWNDDRQESVLLCVCPKIEDIVYCSLSQ